MLEAVVTAPKGHQYWIPSVSAVKVPLYLPLVYSSDLAKLLPRQGLSR